jgi:hypothetical protein
MGIKSRRSHTVTARLAKAMATTATWYNSMSTTLQKLIKISLR